MPIRIAIVDDDQVLANSLKQELEIFTDIECISVSPSGFTFVANLAAATALPDIVVMDISMSMADEGIIVTRMLHEKYPEIKTIMFTVAEDDNYVFEAFKSGAVGCLLKNEKPAFIHKTIVDVYEGGALMSPGIALKAIHFLTGAAETKNQKDMESLHLTERELDVLRLTARGYTYEFMADKLFVSNETVKKHMSNIFKKLHVKNKVEALNKTRGWL